MIAGIRVLWLAMLVPVSGALLMAQHGHASITNSAGIGHSPIAPLHMPPTIGIGRSSIPGSAPVYGNHYAGFGPAFGGYNRYAYGPWRSGSRYGRFNYGLPYAYFGAPYYLPFLDGPYSNDFDSYNSSVYPSDPQGGAPPEGGGLSEQVQQLSAQINGLQNQLAQGTRPSPLRDESTSSSSVPPSPALTLVLTSGQTLEVQNYAVMGDTFWDFSSQPARKIPVSKIDIPASARASEANGAEFPQIGSGR